MDTDRGDVVRTNKTILVSIMGSCISALLQQHFFFIATSKRKTFEERLKEANEVMLGMFTVGFL